MRNPLKVLLLVCLVTGGIGCGNTNQRQVEVSPDLNPADSPASSPSQPVTTSSLEGAVDGTGSPQGQISAPLSEVLSRYVQKPEDSGQINDLGLDFEADEETLPHPGMNARGFRTRVRGRASGSCGGKACPEEDDPETEEDLRYSLPPRK